MWLMVICSSVDIVAGDDLKLFTIHVKDDMASGTPCVTRVNCTGFWNKMWPGQEFHYSDLRKSRVVCTATWNDKDSNWQAFDPSRDAENNSGKSRNPWACELRAGGRVFGQESGCACSQACKHVGLGWVGGRASVGGRTFGLAVRQTDRWVDGYLSR
ncbi:hypothetical protein QYF36_002339 [Acer negundo]|nr:hypothetical protein QYF36_002339 [Acer negundo]